VIRIVKIISPATLLHPDGDDGAVPIPVEGELVRRMKRFPDPVSFNVDTPRYASLKILFGDGEGAV